MPALKTEVTEVVTGLALFDFPDVATALAAPPPPERFANVPGEVWERLAAAERSGALRVEFHAAWANGRAFLKSGEGLRGRPPLLVEWKGGHRAPGDDVVPADLRVDHVYLVSCKYLSKILSNRSPWALFDHALRGGAEAAGTGDWYLEVAPDAYQELYDTVRGELAPDLGLPPFAADLTVEHRAVLKEHVPKGWSPAAEQVYRAFAAKVAQASAQRWRQVLATKREREAMLWRLLRISAAPYFILGSSDTGTIRVRVATPWDWRQAFDLRAFDIWGDAAGQPVVRWKAVVREKPTGDDHEIKGHVEVRWSHRRFVQPPEAKVYLDTPHHRVPGYFPLR